MKLMRKRVLITGANGLLGQNLLHVFAQNYDCTASGRNPEFVAARPEVSYRPCDITRRAEVVKLVREVMPNFIINAAAFTDVDGSEQQREACWQVNATAVGYLSEAARQVGARLIHVSTDYVFDGTSGPYTEAHRPNPLGFYGRAKLAGENAVIGSGASYAIARTMVLYGHGRRLRPNFVTWLIGQLRNGNAVRIVTDQFGNPTLASELAAALRVLAEAGRDGIYHICGREIIDRYHFALKIAEVFALNARLIAPIRTVDLKQQAPRPMHSGFDISKAVQELGIAMSGVVEGLQKFKRESADGQAA
ncbi:MAG: dTDP-4-dehydrorhamnose reductase [candidate division KSB1 bacterium]|nr:dTDP-4-dehydrorhamnose reductase [candidate division KSB1 bacterium]MDZ7274678.1 dTDP-4-dehydrorhamnose reductase [candidate division KSB1 bacterium]MDZ7285503.1 dTDP-4-dehydrorhamnose reductase [candidate division KSB1 bacterium]MDZ7298535.1 dTDP-4-dehydrorhamnose reductase [candidate division KSB1 bacterium]MDZ7306613.1 dTDP-4-dehydrorhamnose reductase [candidate division KSB1 bacterium]